jgi:hypothetical protein
VYHGTLTCENVLVTDDTPSVGQLDAPGSQAAWHAGLAALTGVSLGGLEAAGYRSRRDIALADRDLARLAATVNRHPGVTRTDFLRFLHVYMRRALHGRAGWKQRWRQIARLVVTGPR